MAMHNTSNQDIDFVITYVDGNDINWQTEKNKYTPGGSSDVNPNRYREWNNLQYLFRGIMNKIKAFLKSEITQNGIWLVLLQVFNTIVPLVTLPYITRILSTSAYGQFSAALNWIGYFQVIVEYGFGLSGARRIAMRKSDKELYEIHSNIIFSRICLTIPCLIIFGCIIKIMRVDSTQAACMLILFLMVIATVFQQTYFFQGIGKMQNIAIINIISRSVSVILTFIIVKDPSDLYLYCLLYCSNYIVSGLVGCMVVRRNYSIRLRFSGIKRILETIKEGWYLFVSSAMSKIFGSIGVTILTFVAPYSEVGVYSAIHKVPYVLTLLFAAISQAIYPYNCKAFGISYKGGVSKVKKIGSPIYGLFVIAGLILILFRSIIVRIAFGAEYVQGASLLIPFVIWVLFSILNNFLGVQILVASGHQKEYSHAFTISILIMVVLMFALGYLFNSMGIAMATMFSEIFLTCLLINNVRKFGKTCENQEKRRS